MSELSPIDPLDIRLEHQALQAGQIIRSQQLALRQKLVDDSQVAHVRANGNETALAHEVESLKERMTWLGEHPRLSRYLGKSAVGVELNSVTSAQGFETLTTRPVHDGDVFNITDGHLLVSGLVFWKFYSRYNSGDQTLYVRKQVRDETTGAAISRKLYDFHPFTINTGPRVQVTTPPFREYAWQMRKQIFDAYATDNESVRQYFTHYSDYPGTSDGRRIGQFELYGSKNVQDKKTRHHLNEVLAPQMEQGGGWDYPDEIFETPLAIVRQMNILLGTRQKR